MYFPSFVECVHRRACPAFRAKESRRRRARSAADRWPRPIPASFMGRIASTFKHVFGNDGNAYRRQSWVPGDPYGVIRLTEVSPGGRAFQVEADPDWLDSLITRRVPLGRYAEAFQSPGDDIKVVIELGEEE
jgi:hypothetical protein